MGVQHEEIQLRIVASGNAAKKELADLGMAKTDLKRKIEGLNKGTKDYTATKRKLETELKSVNVRMRKLRGEIDLNSMSTRDLRNRVKDLDRAMENLNPDSKEWKRLNTQLTATKGRMRELRGSSNALRSSWDSMKQGIKGGILAFAGIEGIRRLWNGAKNAVQDYIGQAKAVTKVEQAIKSTAGAAGLSISQLRNEAEMLQKNTLFGDETILNDSTAQLLTFTNIANDEFLRTQRVALDLSTVLDGDLKSASIQLGKALNDPVANLSALSRSGIQFSKAQKEVIKDLANSNRLAEAQGVILDELERQYGGQAEAAAKAGGAWKQLGNLWGDLSENMGRMFNSMSNDWLPELKKLVEYFIDITNVNPSDEMRVLNREFNIQMETLKAGNLSAENRAKLIGEINTKYGDYLPNLITEKTSLEDLKVAQDAANTAFESKINMMAAEEALQDIRKRQIDNEVEALKLQEKLQRSLVEIEEAKNSGGQDRSKSGVNRDLEFAKQRLKDTEIAIRDNASANTELAKEFEVVNQAAMNFGLTLEEDVETKVVDAKDAIDQANKDLEKFNELLKKGGKDEVGGFDEYLATDGIDGDDAFLPPEEDAELQEWLAQKADFEEHLADMRRTQKEQELFEEEAYWDEMMQLNEDYYGGATDLEERKREAIAGINAKWDKQELAAVAEQESNKQAIKRETFMQAAKMSSQFLGFIGDYMEKGSAAQIATASTQVAIDTATSISSAIKGATEAAAAGGPTAPFLMLGYITSMIGSVMGAFTQVTSIVDSAKASKVDTDVSVPSFGSGFGGRVLKGQRHGINGKGGLRVMDDYGNVQAMFEGGESLIPEDTSVANMPLIEAMLNNRGKSIMPVPAFNVDTVALQRSVTGHIPSFGDGFSSSSNGTDGVSFDGSSTSTQSSVEGALAQQIERLIHAVQEEKARPAIVSQRQLKDKEEDLDYIRSYSDIRKAV